MCYSEENLRNHEPIEITGYKVVVKDFEENKYFGLYGITEIKVGAKYKNRRRAQVCKYLEQTHYETFVKGRVGVFELRSSAEDFGYCHTKGANRNHKRLEASTFLLKVTGLASGTTYDSDSNSKVYLFDTITKIEEIKFS